MVRVVRRELLAAGVGLALGGAATWWMTRPEPLQPPPVLELEAGLPPGHYVRDLALSPDASRLAYAGEVDGRTAIYVRALDAPEPRPLAGTDGGRHPFFSPDGAWVGFFAADGLRKVPVQGGPVEDVCDAPAGSAGASWGPDGRIVFAPLGGRGLAVVDADGGVPEVLTRVDAGSGEVAHGWPYVLPGGAGVVFTIARASREPRLAVLGPDDEAPRLLLPANGHVQYVPGHLVYGYSGQLMALDFDLATLDAGAAPVTVAGGLSGSPLGFDGLGSAVFAGAPAGVIAFLPGTQAPPPARLVWVGRDGASSPLSEVAARQRTPRLSPRGSRVAIAVQDGQFGRQIWIETIGGGRRLLTREGGDNQSPVWSPDGGALAFASNRLGPQNMFVRPAAAGGTARRLVATAGVHNPASWRGSLLAFYEVGAETARDIWVLDEAGNARPVVATMANERAPALSPDGRWLAFTSDESATDEIYVQPLAGGERIRVSSGGGTEPVWAPAGRVLYYRRGDRMLAASFRDTPSPVVADTETLFERAYQRDPGANVADYDVAPDGRFLMLRRADAPRDLRVLVNWRG